LVADPFVQMIRADTIRRAALAALLLALIAIPFAPARVVGTLLVAGFVPGATVAGRARLGLAGRLGLALALSPVLFGAVVLAAIALGVPSGAAAWVSALAWAVIFTFSGPSRAVTTAEERRIAIAVLAVFAVAAGLALMLPLADSWWRVRGDSWFHAAVYHRLAGHGLPLVDPYFSPLRLQYMYFYHAILAGVAGLARLDPFHAMIAANAIALAGCLAAFDWLASFFSRRLWPRALGAALLVFGMNGLFFLFYPIRLARALVGETAGVEVLRAFFPWSPPGHDTAAALLAVEGNQFFFLDKFMLGTAFSLALGLVCILLGLLVAARVGRWSRSLDWAWAIALAGLLHLHVVIGMTAWVATVGLLALLLLIRSHTDEGGPSYERLLWLALAALIVAAPYLYTVLPRGGGPESVRLAVQPRYLIGLLSDVLPALVLAVPFLRWSVRRSEAAEGSPSAGPLPRRAGPDAILTGRFYSDFSLSATGMVLFWFLGVLAAAVVVDLPTNNETKFSYLLFIPVAAFAVGGLERAWQSTRGRRVALALVLLSTVPLNAVYFHQAVRDPSTFPLSDDERAAYAWIARATPRDAIFIEENDIVRIPVLAGRDQYWGTEAYALNWGYPGEEIRRRRAVRDAVFAEGGFSETHSTALSALGRPVYVVYRRHEDDLIDANERFVGDPRYAGHFATPRIAVFELKLSR
jgi:hypothetical protein